MDPREYEAKKEQVADALVARVEAFLPGLAAATVFREVGTPRTHRRFLGREDGSYGPIPLRRPVGMLGMPFNRTAIKARAGLVHGALHNSCWRVSSLLSAPLAWRLVYFKQTCLRQLVRGMN